MAVTGKVFAVFGSKGGVGKTTIALNLAALLARKRRKVALLEINSIGGNLPRTLALMLSRIFILCFGDSTGSAETVAKSYWRTE